MHRHRAPLTRNRSPIPWLALALFALALLASACKRSSPTAPAAAPAGELRVVVTIPPVRGIIVPLLDGAQIKHVTETLIPPGASEHGYEIPPSKLAALDQADVVVMVGLGLEPQVEAFLAKHANPNRRVIVLSQLGHAPDEGAPAPESHSDHADHEDPDDPDDDHHHHAADPHIWLDPVYLGQTIRPCAQVFRAVLGSNSKQLDQLDASADALAARVAAVDAAYRETLAKAPRRTIIVGHDAWDRLARRYNLATVSIKGLTAAAPTPASIEAATRAVREKGVTTIFIEPQTSPDAAKRIAAATGAKVHTLDPLGTGDWFKMMESNLREIAAALGAEDKPEPRK